MPSVNEQILHVWKLVDGGGSPITGLAGSMTKTLEYFASGSSLAAGSELVTVAEIGSSGNYSITYTPGNAGLYRLTINETTQGWLIVYEDVVAAVPQSFAETYAYCAESDVCAWAGVADYHSTSVPTEVQVLTFMRMRAAQLHALMASAPKGLGSRAPGPSGSDREVLVTTDAGRSLSYLLQMANAIGAAMDALEASGIGEQPRRSERVAELAAMYSGLTADIMRATEVYGVVENVSVRATVYDPRTTLLFDSDTVF
jgi:hypothetical protein